MFDRKQILKCSAVNFLQLLEVCMILGVYLNNLVKKKKIKKYHVRYFVFLGKMQLSKF